MPYVNGTYYSSTKEGLKAEKEKRKTGSSGSSVSSGSSGSASRPSSGGSSYERDSGSSGGSGASYKTNAQGQRLYSDGYGGYTTVDPNSGSYAKLYGGSAARPASGGVSSPISSGGGSASRDYHQEARDAAAQGDWGAVTKALAARQAKIDAQGGNDRGTSNAQILQNLQQLYQQSYNALSPSSRNTLDMAASGRLNGQGWEDGHDYLAEAQRHAQAGDMEAAYDALLRRGFKMADTGSLGGGTSQDQAYALIQNLYDHSAGAAASYQRQLAENQRRLLEHPTQFGTETNPALANKHFVSADGQYIIYYDGSGTPFKAQPNNGQYGSTKYTPEYRALMEEYYGGSGDYADLRRQMHNLDVVHSGNGRLIDQNWNWASGEGRPLESWADYDPSAVSARNTGQDQALLAGILAKINGGTTFQSPVQVPAVRTAPAYDDLPALSGGGTSSGGSRAPSGSGNGLVSSSTQYGAGDYGGSDLSEYIKQMYQQSLEAQLAGLRSSYDQSRAAYQAQREQLERDYQDQRNQAAAQSDLQRMYMAELGARQGLNTGATGQLALAQSMALQNRLSDLGGLEGQDLAANNLALSQLTSGYLGGVDAARAQNYSDLAGALYSEYARQIQAAEAARQAAQAQANWEAKFNYQMQQDAADRAWQERQFAYQQQTAADEYAYQLRQLEAKAQQQGASNAWDYAQLLLKNGVMPDEATLYAAGLDAGSAQALADSYKWQLGQKYAPKASGSSGSSGKSSGGTDSKPRLTYAQALAAIENGQTSDAAIKAYDYYMGSGAYNQYFGDAGAAGNGGAAGNISTYIQGINNALTNGNTMAADGYLRSIWPNLSEGEKQQMQSVLSRYGIQYMP